MLQEEAKKQNACSRTQSNTSLRTSFNCYFDDPVTGDVVLKAGDTSLHAHKIVLAAQSTLFKAMFQVQSYKTSKQERVFGYLTD